MKKFADWNRSDRKHMVTAFGIYFKLPKTYPSLWTEQCQTSKTTIEGAETGSRGNLTRDKIQPRLTTQGTEFTSVPVKASMTTVMQGSEIGHRIQRWSIWNEHSKLHWCYGWKQFWVWQGSEQWFWQYFTIRKREHLIGNREEHIWIWYQSQHSRWSLLYIPNSTYSNPITTSAIQPDCPRLMAQGSNDIQPDRPRLVAQGSNNTQWRQPPSRSLHLKFQFIRNGATVDILHFSLWLNLRAAMAESGGTIPWTSNSWAG